MEISDKVPLQWVERLAIATKARPPHQPGTSSSFIYFLARNTPCNYAPAETTDGVTARVRFGSSLVSSTLSSPAQGVAYITPKPPYQCLPFHSTHSKLHHVSSSPLTPASSHPSRPMIPYLFNLPLSGIGRELADWLPSLLDSPSGMPFSCATACS